MNFNKQLKRYNEEYNNFPMRPLNWLSPNQYLNLFFNTKSVTDVWQTYMNAMSAHAFMQQRAEAFIQQKSKQSGYQAS